MSQSVGSCLPRHEQESGAAHGAYPADALPFAPARGSSASHSATPAGRSRWHILPRPRNAFCPRMSLRSNIWRGSARDQPVSPLSRSSHWRGEETGSSSLPSSFWVQDGRSGWEDWGGSMLEDTRGGGFL